MCNIHKTTSLAKLLLAIYIRQLHLLKYILLFIMLNTNDSTHAALIEVAGFDTLRTLMMVV